MSSRDWGDFQTPLPLVDEILGHLTAEGRTWNRVFEPTCGQGNFIRGLLKLPHPPREIQGVELQQRHIIAAQSIIEQGSNRSRVVVQQKNIFELDLRRDLHWIEHGPLLIIGNPPWITNAELGAIGSNNLPRKTNLKGVRGIEAVTGSANFDVAEYICLKLIRELGAEQPTIALLCKSTVARNVLQFSWEQQLPISKAYLRRINAKKWFDASVDACLEAISKMSVEAKMEA